ncbi:MAG: hypothetical protein ABS99_00310 [Acetobacteraceae bacterium SCN 69-10]|nr:alpha/beta hydrolase [Rhodospirillales bacterium]ODU62534.1 MAG: hypothetical protein ABS99_00310 [Acetobacteraceae bacterium SCN 69-10]OJY76842.1 MAG: hypothetical protein BGP12_05170 [Rhodospirillales bacterium 70-18]
MAVASSEPAGRSHSARNWPRWASPLGLLNALAAQAGVKECPGLRYGPHTRHLLDAYLPLGASGPAPVAVFFYGGGWETGERSWYRFAASALAARGVLTLVPDYRLFPEVRFPAFLDDAAAAVAWAGREAAALGGDPARLFLMGHSAGAYIAAMLALQPGWLSGAPAGMIGLAGPYDFLPLGTDRLRAIFGPEADLPQTQPVNFVSSAAPPMMLATGGLDRTVLPRNTRRLTARLREAGVAVRERIYPALGHRLVAGALARPLQPLLGWLGAPVLDDMLDFISDPRAPR